MSTTAIHAEALPQPIAVPAADPVAVSATDLTRRYGEGDNLEDPDPPSQDPSTTLEPPRQEERPEEERPDTEGDRRVGDIDDLPRPHHDEGGSAAALVGLHR
jgi:hypothetical protein